MAKEGVNTLSLKLLINKHSKKVLFAEAGKDFVDFLFHLMTLPIGTVIRLLKNNGMVGCVGNLYSSIENIGAVYMESAPKREALLKPKSTSCEASFPLLLPDSSPSACKTYYKCYNNHICTSFADYPNAICPQCGKIMNQKVDLLEATSMKAGTIPPSGYVKEAATFMVKDNLEVKPTSALSGIALLNQFNVKDVGDVEEKVIAVGMNKALELLKTSLHSENVLTDVFVGKVGQTKRSRHS